MFRKLSRHKQQLSDGECIQILIGEPRGVLSVMGDGGYPYGLPIDHWYCEGNGKLYFHCGKDGHKLDAIRACDKVSYCVMDGGTPEEGGWALYFRSVIVFGRVRIIEDEAEVVQITRQLSYKFTDDAAYIEDEIAKYAAGTLCIELTPEHICGKRVHEA